VAEALIAQACEQQQIARDQLTVHADCGSSMTSWPVAMLLSDLGVTKTHSRPYTSTDNPYSEAQFKTLKYRPGFPVRFDSIEHARGVLPRVLRLVQPPPPPRRDRPDDPRDRPPRARQGDQRGPQRRARRRLRGNAERFVRKPPTPPPVPAAAWVNKLNNDEAAH